ncbi:hypothetical protein BU26DRAFT_559443 [Trematosphaeria pertusa]|uniref:Uncharacterized protein n=1 Tax=Trematosphaeria pertusa TaxID=390896 RepID=A0A6A6IXN9_9PLEO|nr:uncharacterized protein BU26DRAFT_559443 [Trematosphaeria pertusa]KAF2254787.1 hypothetical protein BU26DRAFT_559443 [Trematosphaeria pertusa]
MLGSALRLIKRAKTIVYLLATKVANTARTPTSSDDARITLNECKLAAFREIDRRRVGESSVEKQKSLLETIASHPMCSFYYPEDYDSDFDNWFGEDSDEDPPMDED